VKCLWEAGSRFSSSISTVTADARPALRSDIVYFLLFIFLAEVSSVQPAECIGLRRDGGMVLEVIQLFSVLFLFVLSLQTGKSRGANTDFTFLFPLSLSLSFSLHRKGLGLQRPTLNNSSVCVVRKQCHSLLNVR